MRNLIEIEESVIDFWQKNRTYETLKEERRSGKPFYYLDGPPYTSGRIHIGHAWGKTLRDMVMRYKRMQGFDVFDRAGFDMHGLPTSHKVQAKFNLSGKKDIESFGRARFTEECKALALENMEQMIKDFRRLGVWMDFDDPYMPVNNEYIEGVWWIIKQAFEKDRLYEGYRTLHWDPKDETALAKHELEYKRVTDESIFVRFKIPDAKDEYLLVWTTTPWTIPYNLAVMVNPDVTYAKVNVRHGSESYTLIIAQDLVEHVMERSDPDEWHVTGTLKGTDLDGTKYMHPFADLIDYASIESDRLHTVVLSSEYVDTSAGSGLVHCAPGCGPEDYEVGHANGLIPFNTVNEKGVVEDLGPFTGLAAKTDDKQFVEKLREVGALYASEPYVHDYPHAERSKAPVVFRATKQWFLKVEDLKDRMKELNRKVHWVPEWAGANQFHNWIDNLRDNSITKQIHWGTPFPIWRSEDGELIVIGSADDLKAHGVPVPENLHKPFIDEVVIEKDGKTYTRIPDVLDVWVDAGAASWLALDYPKRTDLFERFFPADFITEGKDQIRGWFNLLFVEAIIGFDTKAFDACYMTGFVQDAQGRKMSKSLGNIISPDEVISKYGADVMRYYMVQAANPGEDMNYNFEDIEVKQRNLTVLFNLFTLLAGRADGSLESITSADLKDADAVSRATVSKIHSTVKRLTEAYDAFELDSIPNLFEDLYLELSRTFVQLKREEIAEGSKLALRIVADGLRAVLLAAAPVMPHIAEHLYQEHKDLLGFSGASVHHERFPSYDAGLIDSDLESSFELALAARQAALAAREKAGQGIRWPLRELVIAAPQKEIRSALERYVDDLALQLNVKQVSITDRLEGVSFSADPDKGAIGRAFKAESKKVLGLVEDLTEDQVETLASEGSITVEGFEITSEMVAISSSIPDGWVSAPFAHGSVYLSTTQDDELVREGYLRELTRAVQQMRKDAGLTRDDAVTLGVGDETAGFFTDEQLDELASRVNATIGTVKSLEDVTVREKTFSVGIERA